MIKEPYVAKISSQGQITLPKTLRNELKILEGSNVLLRANADGELVVGGKFPIEKYFGTLGDLTGGMDAAEYIRKMRDEDNAYREKNSAYDQL